MHKLSTKHLFGLLAILYPVFVFFTLVIFKLPIRYLSIGIIIFGISYSALNLKHNKGNHKIALFVSPVILIIIGIISLCLDENPIAIKMYPVLADLSFLTIMVTSIIVQPPLVYHFVNAIDKEVKDIIPKDRLNNICTKATFIWCVFFIIDAIIAATIAFRGDTEADNKLWGIYCGGITYGVMALIFISDYVIIKRIKKMYILQDMNKEKQEDVNS